MKLINSALHFFKILDQKIDSKYNYTPSPFINTIWWFNVAIIIALLISNLFLIIVSLINNLMLALTVEGIKISDSILETVSILICGSFVYILKETGMKWLWLLLVVIIVSLINNLILVSTVEGIKIVEWIKISDSILAAIGILIYGSFVYILKKTGIKWLLLVVLPPTLLGFVVLTMLIIVIIGDILR